MKLRFGWGPIDGAEGMQRNVDLVRTVREAVGDGVDVMADAYMGWTLDYAKRMLPLLEPFNLRWLEEPVIPDDLHGYAELKRYGPHPDRRRRARVHAATVPRPARGARRSTSSSSTPIASAASPQARKIAALAEAYGVPVVPHAGQMHNYHVVMASLNSPMAEYFPPVDVEVGNELFWYIFDGEPKAEDGYIDLDDDVAGARPHGQRGEARRVPGHGVTAAHRLVVQKAQMARVVQLTDGTTRRVAARRRADAPLRRWRLVNLRAGHAGHRAGDALSGLVQSRANGHALDYDEVYAGRGTWRLLPPIDHPAEPTRCLVSGTGLTHFGSARNRQAMHLLVAPTGGAHAAEPTDSMRMFQFRAQRGPTEPGDRRRPGVVLQGRRHDPARPRRAAAACRLRRGWRRGGRKVAASTYRRGGPPRRMGMAAGNEFSDYRFERKKNYLNLAGIQVPADLVGAGSRAGR